MYLSRVELDLTRRSTMEALAAPQKLHGAVESAFAGERRRRLWRLDRLGERLYLLLLSEDAPDLSGVVEQFGTGAAAETRSYDPLLERVVPGSCWQFRLTANPPKSRKDPKAPAERGSVMAHCSTKYQKQWLMDRAAKHGFALREEEFTVTRVQWQRFAKRGTRPVTLLAVTYEGVLQVTDIPRAEGAFPFVPCPVQTVDGQDDPLAGEAGEPGEHGRPFGVDVDHVIGAERRRKTAEEAGCHRRKALAVDGGHPLEPDATVFVEVLDVVFFSADVMAGAVVAGDAVAVHHHPRGKLLYNDLDPSFP